MPADYEWLLVLPFEVQKLRMLDAKSSATALPYFLLAVTDVDYP